ncbi:LacI family DNA-binding transcriptional regulator [Ponticoccus alexandrii]|uniref:Substrate-binding domain-containing protein n=1 Tax=Ponticoccus alexandrii TaxID=1943633 RepID=A0ABX7FFL4_9RHOB|nr:LacI family DNA-binding transcriptional regulator [Ponticoccus alexandrii]ETA49425.1 transcriptional regulator [Rhodobacteraceae bacterium PD-2]QRF69321.1 substrate-binding domain-containing protein [Ponticoccus alexandrii]
MIPPRPDAVLRIPRTAQSPAPSGKVGLKDVAKLAGVAPITVSRALSDPAKVSADKRGRIEAAMKATGYQRDAMASALRSGRSRIVVAYQSNMLSSEFSRALRACAGVLETAGYQFLIGQTGYSYEREAAAIQSLSQLRPAAVLFTGVIEMEDNRDRLRALGVPILETWAWPPDPIDMLVGFSNTDAGRMAAEHLARQGHRRVAVIGRATGRGALRHAGFASACAELGLTVAETLHAEPLEGTGAGSAALARLLDRAPDIDAVFFSNSVLAIGGLYEALRRGLDLPRELAIVGFGHHEDAGNVGPGLTTVGIDTTRLGRTAGELLLARLGGEQGLVRHAMVPTLCPRGSG